jgi:hypothetical protein
MKYVVEMSSGAMIHISSVIKIGSARVDTQTHRQHGDRISVLSFFRNKESRLMKLYFHDYVL